MPIALPIGIATVSATIARTRRSSLVASRRSRRATSSTLCRSRLSQLMVVPHDCQVDVLQRRQLAKLSAGLEARTAPELGQVADRQRTSRGHDPDLACLARGPREIARFRGACENLGLFHAVGADDERAAFLLQALQIVPSAPGAVEVERLEQFLNAAPAQRRLDVVDRAEVVEVGAR